MTNAQRVIDILSAAPQGLTTREICDLAGRHPGSIAAILSGLASRGEIERTIHRDETRMIFAIWKPKAKVDVGSARVAAWEEIQRVPE